MDDKHLPILDNLISADQDTCFQCGETITDANRTSVQQIRPDGKTTQPLCQNCYRLDDVVDLRDISP